MAALCVTRTNEIVPKYLRIAALWLSSLSIFLLFLVILTELTFHFVRQPFYDNNPTLAWLLINTYLWSTLGGVALALLASSAAFIVLVVSKFQQSLPLIVSAVILGLNILAVRLLPGVP